MSWDVSNSYYSGQGIVMLAKRDANGEPMGFTPIGNVSDLKISVSVSTIEHKESQTGQRAIDLRLTTETKSALSMTVENFIAANLADALRGSNTQKMGGTVTAEPVKAYLGKVVALKHIRVSNVAVKDGASTLVAGTDYEVNEDAGSIRFKDTISGVADGDTLSVSYSYGAQVQVDALTEGAKELYMRFEGLNTAEGNVPVVVEVFKFLTDPLKELSLISDSIQQFTLEGSVLADSTKTSGSKFFRVTKLN
jgi:hypothetical protein